MPIYNKSFFQSNPHDISNIISFRDLQNPFHLYQQVNSPFMIAIVACHPGAPDTSAFSIFSPETQGNYSADESLKFRPKNSMHQHNHFEIMYTLKGNVYQNVEGKRYLYTPGSCCLLNRHTLHTEEFSTDYVSIFFSVSIDFAARFTCYDNSSLFPHEQNLLSNSILQFLEKNMELEHKSSKDFLDFVPRISETEQKDIVHNIFEQMIFTLLHPYYGATFRLQDLFCQLIVILSNPEYYHIVHVTTKSNMESLLFARIDQLLSEQHGRISNAELARLLNYDGSYLGRIVKKFTGKSLFDYSMTFTMATAEQMLKHTKKSVSRIAEELHFSNRTHFYKVFEKYYHMSPKKFRDEISSKK